MHTRAEFTQHPRCCATGCRFCRERDKCINLLTFFVYSPHAYYIPDTIAGRTITRDGASGHGVVPPIAIAQRCVRIATTLTGTHQVVNRCLIGDTNVSIQGVSTTGADTFGAKVEEYRERLGMQQKELAEGCGLSRSHLNRIEKGTRKRPHVETVLRMIVALRLTPTEAEELVELAGLSPLVLEKIDFDKDGRASGLVKIAEREAPSGVQPVMGQPSPRASSSSIAFGAPISPSDPKILMRRLAIMEKKLQAAENNLRDANEEMRELRTLAAKMLSMK